MTKRSSYLLVITITWPATLIISLAVLFAPYSPGAEKYSVHGVVSEASKDSIAGEYRKDRIFYRTDPTFTFSTTALKIIVGTDDFFQVKVTKEMEVEMEKYESVVLIKTDEKSSFIVMPLKVFTPLTEGYLALPKSAFPKPE